MFFFLKDFDILGTKLISCGMDHSLKIWNLETDKLKEVCQYTCTIYSLGQEEMTSKCQTYSEY